MIYPKLTDMLPRPVRWRTIADYAIYREDRFLRSGRRLVISPILFGFKHVEASYQFDQRRALDAQFGLNRAAKYIPTRGSHYG